MFTCEAYGGSCKKFKAKKMKKDNLSDEINEIENMYDASNLANTSSKRNDWLWVKSVKEKIQNAQRRLRDVIIRPNANNCLNMEDILLEINKIFKEEFGDKLT